MATIVTSVHQFRQQVRTGQLRSLMSNVTQVGKCPLMAGSRQLHQAGTGQKRSLASGFYQPKADIALYLERGRRIRFLESYWPPQQRLVCEVVETDAYPANEQQFLGCSDRRLLR